MIFKMKSVELSKANQFEDYRLKPMSGQKNMTKIDGEKKKKTHFSYLR